MRSRSIRPCSALSAGGGEAGFQIGVKDLFGGLTGTDLKAVIVGYAEDPTAQAFDFFALFEAGIEPQEDFLHGFLRLGRMNAQRQQVPVNVFASLYKQLSHLVL